jgi:hypothetical protein
MIYSIVLGLLGAVPLTGAEGRCNASDAHVPIPSHVNSWASDGLRFWRPAGRLQAVGYYNEASFSIRSAVRQE